MKEERAKTKTPVKTGLAVVLCLMMGCGGDDQGGDTSAAPDAPLVITTPAPIAPLEGGGTITGVVKFDGPLPPVKTFIPNKDTEICGTEERAAGDVLIGPDLGIRNVVVWIADAPETALNTSIEAMMDQKGCLFTPRIARVATGAPMTFLNNDNILHNIHTVSTTNPPLNEAQPGFMKRLKKTFTQPEIIEVACDVHSWMKGWIVVQSHPYYAVTDEQGAFTLPHTPAGAYTLRYWHETFGEQTLTGIEVKDNETVVADAMFRTVTSGE